MLRQMLAAAAAAGPGAPDGDTPPPLLAADGAGGGSARREKPLTLTKEAVAALAQSGKPIDRASFRLVTRGYGPIGAPTMTLDEALAIDMALMAPPSGAGPEQGQAAPPPPPPPHPDDHSDEQADLETYRARAHDEFTDFTRRRDGNRLGMG
jgi:immunoglobulin-binding protein 1